LRILFSVKNPDYVRHYAPVLRALAARGHQVELVKQSARHPWPPHVTALAREHPAIHLSTLPDMGDNPWWELATRFRQTRLYLRFLEPSHRTTTGLLDRARKRAPRLAVWLGESARLKRRGRRLLRGVIDVLEGATRSAAFFHGYLGTQRPDIVVLTPLVVLKTTQLDLARAARELGIRNVFAVTSWDHLSSKGVLDFAPQQVFVWNDAQKREAVEMHEVGAERVVVTGSQVFDDWFERRPSRSREAFCAQVGLRNDRPILLYVCSSLLENSPPEASFVVRWTQHLRQSAYPVLQDCGILVRPHPRRGREWRGVSLAGFTNMVCWPPAGELPIDGRSQADFFDSLYYADAVVGLNTSVMIEAAIVGRPVHTVLLPEFRDSQEGTLHFHYLLDGADSPLYSARSLDEHARDLAAALDHRGQRSASTDRFVRAFVRPRGLDVPATRVFVEALEALAANPAPAPEAEPAWTYLVRPLMWPFARAAVRRAHRIRDQRRQQKMQTLLEHRRRKAATAVDNMTSL
jgi:hypothetical protein